jgi:hypothetical protein
MHDQMNKIPEGNISLHWQSNRYQLALFAYNFIKAINN